MECVILPINLLLRSLGTTFASNIMRESKAKMSNAPPVKFRCKIKSVWPFLHRHCIGSRHNLPSSIILYDLCSVWFTTVLVTTVRMQLILQFLCQLSKPPTVMNASIEKEERSNSASKLVQTCFNVSSDKWRAIIKLHCMQSF